MAHLKIIIGEPTKAKLEELGVFNWGIWIKEPSSFEWRYDQKETCFILDGEVVVETPFETVSFSKGDLVTFPEGLSCTWHIKKHVRKHYKFG